MAALVMALIQFDIVKLHYPSLHMGSCVDDRNIRGSKEDVVDAYKFMAKYDAETGHFNNLEKMAMTATCKKVRELDQQHQHRH